MASLGKPWERLSQGWENCFWTRVRCRRLVLVSGGCMQQHRQGSWAFLCECIKLLCAQ